MTKIRVFRDQGYERHEVSLLDFARWMYGMYGQSLQGVSVRHGRLFWVHSEFKHADRTGGWLALSGMLVSERIIPPLPKPAWIVYTPPQVEAAEELKIVSVEPAPTASSLVLRLPAGVSGLLDDYILGRDAPDARNFPDASIEAVG